MVHDLEARLRGISARDVGTSVDQFFDSAKPDLLTIAPADFKSAIENAVSAGS